jgi:hypothetical protein
MNTTHGRTEAKGSNKDDVSGIVAELQRLADSHETVQLAARVNRRLRILFVVGSSLPWRAIECDRELPRRRMMCFREFKQLQRFVVERLDRERAYEKFVSEQMATPADLPGITTGWLPSYSFGDVLEAYRDEIGDRTYRTAPDRVIKLSLAPGISV